MRTLLLPLMLVLSVAACGDDDERNFDPIADAAVDAPVEPLDATPREDPRDKIWCEDGQVYRAQLAHPSQDQQSSCSTSDPESRWLHPPQEQISCEHGCAPDAPCRDCLGADGGIPFCGDLRDIETFCAPAP